jgi:hypothetical protein
MSVSGWSFDAGRGKPWAVTTSSAGFFVAEYPALVRTVTLVLHDRSRAEEIAQDAFVQLLRHWSKVCRYESPGAWVRRVAIRLAVRDANRERRLAQLRPRSVDEAPALNPGVDVDLMAAIKTLPPRQRSQAPQPERQQPRRSRSPPLPRTCATAPTRPPFRTAPGGLRPS